MPNISVIVPVYKVEKYICRCVDSLLKQTYPDMEIILVDDGSKDSSVKVIKELAEKEGMNKSRFVMQCINFWKENH